MWNSRSGFWKSMSDSDIQGYLYEPEYSQEEDHTEQSSEERNAKFSNVAVP